jgi:uncharacterized protein YfaS (alpha-2-macroglobulin family)
MAGTTAGPYDVGDVVRLAVAVGVAGVPTDPGAITLYVQPPSGALDTIAGGTLTHDGTGAYHYDLPINAPGHWQYRFVTTGTGAAAEESDFWVRTPAF